MRRFAFKQISILVLLAGLALRALTPLGYMPGAPGSGWLFELCPDQFPAGFGYRAAGASSHHHGNKGETQQDAEPDRCQIGHLLLSAIAVDQAMAQLNAVPDAPLRAISLSQTFPHLPVLRYQPRGPPT